MFEIKGGGIAKLTRDLPEAMAADFIDQATRQVEASGGRPVVWIFAEERAALFAREVFDHTKGLEGITVGYVPWIGGVRR
jgi:NADPH-dependent ferric siderophore reductase